VVQHVPSPEQIVLSNCGMKPLARMVAKMKALAQDLRLGT